ncbi:MAG: EamA family transporter [Kiritimatiellales bacterium]|nr:EamA family transporter [Kiritimatiellota bacterium]MBL7012531.1 EamA family transporter [Kiritimatiellales bacterium]
MTERAKGIAALLAGITLFSTIEVASKLMQIGGGGVAGRYPFWLAFFRFVITGVVLFFPALHGLRLRGVVLTGKDILALSGLGLLGVTLMSSLYHLAITFLPANVAALVFSCNPVFVVLFAPLVLPEKITPRKLGAVILCLGGVFVLARDRADGISLTGLLLMLVAIIIFALYTVLFKKMTPRCGALPVTAFAGLVGGVFILPLALKFEGFPLASYASADWIGITYLALIGTAMGYFLYIYGIGQVGAGAGSMAFFLKPFAAAFFAWLVLGEKFSAPECIAGAFILAGMVVALAPVSPKRTD